MKLKKPVPPRPEKQKALSKIEFTPFPIVGIGASAGGLEALEEFFGNVSKNCGIAFVVIQHLDPTHVGIMPELLQRTTEMSVFQATDKLKVKPNCVYVIPPNKSMSILKDTLYLFDPQELRGLRLPIDIFFRALADDRLGKSIGIILSGMGSDGSLGVRAIKEKGGMVLVQEPASAKFDSMPRAAISAVVADIIAPARELPVKLVAYFKNFPKITEESKIDIGDKSNLDKIIILLREQSGNDFSLYKKNTLMRRIERRKGIHLLDRIQDYVRFLQGNPGETEILFKELLIGVTSFFRDTEVWETLKESILPAMFRDMPDGYILRAWVPGCSTGEEAYSLAIIFKETLQKNKIQKNLTLQIFATDLDVDAIEQARKGVFPKNIEAVVSPERLRLFFSNDLDGYRVNKPIRDMVVFAAQNVIRDPPFTKLDILTCRNLLIYLEPELQKKLILLFAYSLNHGGIMVLGTAESFGKNNDEFEDLDSKMKIFRRSELTPPAELIDFPSSFSNKHTIRPKAKAPVRSADNIQEIADQILLQHFSPASVLVNMEGDIIYITGHTGKYLEPAAGKTNWNVFAMAREGVRKQLPSAFRRAVQGSDKITLSDIKIGLSSGMHSVDVTIQRLDAPDPVKGMLLIVFTDVPEIIKQEPETKKRATKSSLIREGQLESELHRCQEELQGTREEMQTSQEELKTINEELQSTNEELQSTNEELITSKEEMQSLNEELQTVNLEMQSKISDFVRADDDMKNLLNSTEIATLYLDKGLNIRRFTPQLTKIFKFRDSDFGRPFTDLVTDYQYPEIGLQAKNVLRNLASIETVILTPDGRWFNVRIMPYRTTDDRIDGLVMTFTDISLAKKLEIELKEAQVKLEKSSGNKKS